MVDGCFTGLNGTKKDLGSNIASSLANLCDHLSSRDFRSSLEDLLDFFLLALVSVVTEAAFFLLAGVLSSAA